MGKCLKVKKHKFLWWEWTTEEVEHNWKYDIKNETYIKKCSRCGKKEMYWGMARGSDPEEIWKPMN